MDSVSATIVKNKQAQFWQHIEVGRNKLIPFLIYLTILNPYTAASADLFDGLP